MESDSIVIPVFKFIILHITRNINHDIWIVKYSTMLFNCDELMWRLNLVFLYKSQHPFKKLNLYLLLCGGELSGPMGRWCFFLFRWTAVFFFSLIHLHVYALAHISSCLLSRWSFLIASKYSLYILYFLLIGKISCDLVEVNWHCQFNQIK